MAKSRLTDPEDAPTDVQISSDILAKALTQAILAAKPSEKKNAFNRKVGTPWTPKDGTPKLKLKRKMFQHGLPADEDILSNKEIDLLNQVRPGVYMQGTVKINRRKDRGLDISWPCKTASQRLKLVNAYGVRNLEEVLARCIEEAKQPKLDTTADEQD
jgi:hypothetical protein